MDEATWRRATRSRDIGVAALRTREGGSYDGIAVLGEICATTDVDALLFTRPGCLVKLERPLERAGLDTEVRTAEADAILSWT